MTVGVGGLWLARGLFLPTHGAKGTCSKRDNGHGFGVKKYSVLKETGPDVGTWGGAF